MLNNPIVKAAITAAGPEVYKMAYAAPAVNTQYGMAAAAPTFGDALKFGHYSGAIIVATTLTGFALDNWLSEKIKAPKGWGPLMGAVAGVTATNTIAGLSQGVSPAVGYAVGGVSALIPTAVAAYIMDKSSTDKTTTKVLATIAGLTVLVAALRGVSR